MIKQLRLHLTLICSMMTGLILLLICLMALSISEKEIKAKNHLAFENHLDTLTSQLQMHHTLKHAWLNQLELSHNLMIYLFDNGHPLLFKGTYTPLSNREALIKKAQATGLSHYYFDVTTRPLSVSTIDQLFFNIEGSDHEAYRVALARVPSTRGYYGIIFLQDTSSEIQSIFTTRLLFLGISVFGLILLGSFSYWFVGRAMIPIMKNQEEQTQFIAAASHELKSPLAVIQSSTNALSPTLPNSSKCFAVQIENECTRMARLVDDLLLLATTNQWSIHKTPTDFDSLLIDLLDKFLPLANQKRQQLLLELPDYIVPTTLCDQERISQALSALIDNALYYTQEQGIITLCLSSSSESILLKVIDNGPGIAPIHHQDIFKKFYRLDTSRHDKKHYGLGLSIAQEIIHLHDGHLYLEDTPGGGCTFTLALPIVKKSPEHKEKL